MRKVLSWAIVALFAAHGEAFAQKKPQLPIGQIVDEVECEGDASQHYALYLPTTFSPDRRWPVILGFDAGGRGRRAVERYQAAAEKYGYIVVGSNNSRNGPWQSSLDAAAAMTADVNGRFPVDPRRTYTAGMSGGARVAMMLALSSERIAGVLASSAGFPDEFQESVRFPIFGSMGTDDFNHYEMYKIDHDVKSPHRIEQFVGTHEWLPVELATDGVEWMEIQAMKSGLRTRDQKEIDGIFARRMARAEAQPSDLDRMRELRSIAADFQGFRDVAKIKAQAEALVAQTSVKVALRAEEAAEKREEQTTAEVYDLRDELTLTSSGTFQTLKARLLALADQSRAVDDSIDRRIARRVLSRLSASSRDIYHPEFQDLLNQIRPPRAPGGPQ
jgi:hypothetical protein